MKNLQKQIRTAIVIVFAIFVATGCKKDAVQPNLVKELNNKKWKVEEMSVEGVDFQRYLITNYDYHAEKPTIFQIEIGFDANSAQQSLLYKGENTWLMESGIVTDAGNNAINIFFDDDHDHVTGTPSQYMPEELIDNNIVEQHYYNTGPCYPGNPCPTEYYYTCNSKVINGYYKIKKEYDRYTLARTTPLPEIKIVLSPE